MSERGPMVVRDASRGSVLAARVVDGSGFWQRFMGLMGRPSLDDGEGLFLPDSSIHMFFMRFPIDALFVGPADLHGDRRVVAMRQDLPPWRGIVLPVRGAAGVVELAAGTLASSGLRVGDVVRKTGAKQAIMAKIMENDAAAAALKVTNSPRFAAASGSVPVLEKARAPAK